MYIHFKNLKSACTPALVSSLFLSKHLLGDGKIVFKEVTFHYSSSLFFFLFHLLCHSGSKKGDKLLPQESLPTPLPRQGPLLCNELTDLVHLASHHISGLLLV